MKPMNDNSNPMEIPEGNGALSSIKQLIFGTGRINFSLGIVAVIILLGSLSVLTYTTLTREDTDTVTVNGKEYAWDEMFEDFETTTLNGHEGILLSDLVNDTALKDQEDHDYKIVGADGYFKTVSWDDMQNGLLVKEDKMTVFPEKTKGFWIKDVIEIEVV
ncbi:MAG: hypothetical protein KAU14_04705 [Thermoplasmata archaeon]|nr:hypothetical protein [Thermoplasmata archaeon]